MSRFDNTTAEALKKITGSVQHSKPTFKLFRSFLESTVKRVSAGEWFNSGINWGNWGESQKYSSSNHKCSTETRRPLIPACSRDDLIFSFHL
jgi:hypothetical protein